MNAWYDDPARAELKTTKEAEIVAAEEAEVARIAKEKADAEQKKIDDAAADAAAAAGTGTGTTDTDNPKVTSGNVTDVTVKVTSSDDDGLGAGAIVGIILAVLIVVAVVVALVLFRKKLPCFKNQMAVQSKADPDSSMKTPINNNNKGTKQVSFSDSAKNDLEKANSGSTPAPTANVELANNIATLQQPKGNFAEEKPVEQFSTLPAVGAIVEEPAKIGKFDSKSTERREDENRTEDVTSPPQESFDHKTPMVQASGKIEAKDAVTIDHPVQSEQDEQIL